MDCGNSSKAMFNLEYRYRQKRARKNVKDMQKLLVAALVVMSGMLFENALGAAQGDQAEEIHRAVETAWDYYNKKEYAKARAIVDRYYQRDIQPLVLLSGAMYVREDKCDKALETIAYLEKQYDELVASISSLDNKRYEEIRPEVEYVYPRLKSIASRCNYQLGKWQGAIDATQTYLRYHADDVDSVIRLAKSQMERAKQSDARAINAYERIRETANKGQDGNTPLLMVANFNLPVLYAHRGELDKAVEIAAEHLKAAADKRGLLERMRKSWGYNAILEDKRMGEAIASLGLRQ